MLKFKFNYQQKTLSYQQWDPDTWHSLTDQFEGSFGSLGFQLKDGWINFTVYSHKIRVFYKQISDPGSELSDFWEPVEITYFRKDLVKQEEVIFAFSEKDEVEKVGNSWVRKGEPTM